MTEVATALCAAISIDDAASVPDWLHLLPAGDARSVDGRGPYRTADVDALIAASLPIGAKLPIDQDHATDLAAPRGGAAPARGWIVELQSRGDGLWGRVDWTGEGRRIVEDRQYRGVSPVIAHRKDGTITAILRASLTNTPNLVGLKSLHSQEQGMDFRTMLLGLLKLDSGADDAAITAALDVWKTKGAAPAEVALQSIATAIGIDVGADGSAVLAGVQALKSGGDQAVSLQSQLDALTEDRKRDKAVAFVDAAIGAGRVGLRPVRDEYISMHMADPARTGKLVGAMPIVAPGRTTITAIVGTAEGSETNPTLLAARATTFQAEQAKAGITITYATAVRAVAGEKAA